MGRHVSELKAALVGALRLAEQGVDGLPIPGVKGCIGGILRIIEQEELRKDNLETFRGLVNTITEFRSVTIERLSKAGSLSEELKHDVQDLAKKLRDIPAQYTGEIGAQSTLGRVKGLILASNNAQALNNLATDLKGAIELFQTALLVNIQLAEQKREADRLIDKLTVERKAPFNAHREHEIELCEQDTRVSLLADIIKWAEGTGPNHEQRILWLNGKAGVGKSTIAKTLATRLHEQNMLGSSFMFSKPNGVTDSSKVFTTIAYQLSRHLPEFRDNLVAAIKTKESSIHAEIHEQFEDLLATPLSQLRLSPPTTVIILDALDECTGKMVVAILTLLIENMPRFPFLRLLITSRPENQIQQVLYRSKGHIHEVDINRIPASEDITTYLQRRLSTAYCHLMDDSNEERAWPAGDDVAALARMANNLFVFAATAVRFIGDERAAEPQRRLEAILHDRYVSRNHPFSTLDSMYQEILHNALPEGEDNLHKRFQDVVGVIVFAVESPSVNSLISLLQSTYSASSIRNLIKSLHSVLIVPKEANEPGLQVYHKSFAEFITDRKRCTQMGAYLHPPIHHGRVCNWYFKIAAILHSDGSQEISRQQVYVPGIMTPVQALCNLSLQLRDLIQSIDNDSSDRAARVRIRSDDKTMTIKMRLAMSTPDSVSPLENAYTIPGHCGVRLVTIITHSPVSETLVFKMQFDRDKCDFAANLSSDGGMYDGSLAWNGVFFNKVDDKD